MATPWIKLEHTTPDKPEIAAIANRLGLDPDAAFGKVVRFWIWADQQSVSGNGISVTKTFIDRIVYCPGFAEALAFVGWLKEKSGNFSIPNFDRHNGQSAKSRALTGKRVENKRGTGNAKSVTKSLPELEEDRDPFLSEKGAWFSSPEFSVAWKAWAKQRKKKPGDRQYNDLEKLAAGNIETAIAILNQSADKQWTGLFALKGTANGARKPSRAETLNRDAAELLRDLGGTPQGDNHPPHPAHGGFGSPARTGT